MPHFIIVFILSISFSAGFLFGVFWVAAHQNKLFLTEEEQLAKKLGVDPHPNYPPPKKG